MIGKASSNNLIRGVPIGRSRIEVTHLQFVDDTIIFLPRDDEVVRNYRRLLDYFSLMSGLEINYHKSSVIQWWKDDVWCRNMSPLLHCKVEKLPIKYLGVP